MSSQKQTPKARNHSLGINPHAIKDPAADGDRAARRDNAAIAEAAESAAEEVIATARAKENEAALRAIADLPEFDPSIGIDIAALAGQYKEARQIARTALRLDPITVRPAPAGTRRPNVGDQIRWNAAPRWDGENRRSWRPIRHGTVLDREMDGTLVVERADTGAIASVDPKDATVLPTL